jgi:anti-sigma regulatory factor (Ser/Thr protein kinase)
MITTIADPSQVAQARRSAKRVAEALGFGEEAAGRVAIVASELATNILKHAGEGEIATRRFSDAEGEGVELLALDRGQGMADVTRALGDGYTTAGSRGNGLGAVRRLSQSFGIFSRPGQGTGIVARCTDRAAGPADAAAVVGAICAVCPGETESGDDWHVRYFRDRIRVLIADGSGHGVLAGQAASRAVLLFKEEPDRPLESLAQRIHQALAPTRGAAIAVAELDLAASLVRFVGIGNIGGSVHDQSGVKKLVSMNGTAGHLAPRIRVFEYPCSGPATLVMHSDGIGSRWDLAAYPGLASAHPALSAGILYRDHRRGRDDATVVAVRVEGR